MQLTIRTHPDPVLAAKAKEIEEITDDVRALAKEMTKTMYVSDGIGLAAPQVGHSVRLVVVDVSGPKERTDLMVLVNPEIVESEGQTETEEGCLSVVNYRAKVKRAARVRVKAQDLDGQDVDIDADDILAVCLQHELDHLDGVLFIDRISRLKRTLYENKLKKWIKRRDSDSR